MLEHKRPDHGSARGPFETEIRRNRDGAVKTENEQWRRGAELIIEKTQKSLTKPQKKPKLSTWHPKRCEAAHDCKGEKKQ
jgi:hypothetical protein